jgi:hypothetical protein
MGPIDSAREIRDVGGEDDLIASALQQSLAASVVSRLIERNGGCAAGFWDDDLFDTEQDQDEYLDPELWDPDADPVPDMAAEIAENIFECL